MNDIYEDDWFIDDDDWSEFDAWDDVSTLCVQCGEGDCLDTCQCCGAPLCLFHAECQAMFCMPCLNSPDFADRMAAIYKEMETA